MEKLLAMSFISSPMDFSARPSWLRARLAPARSGAEQKRDRAAAPTAGRHCDATATSRRDDGGAAEMHGEGSCGGKPRPHLALEFDGLHCFETFVIH